MIDLKLNGKDWFVNDEGECQVRPSVREWDLIRERYYLHQFLTEITDILDEIKNEKEEWERLPQIRMRVRQLIVNSYWVQTQYRAPHPQTGSSVLVLYDEIGYPLSVQNVVFSPGIKSPIHNHGTWGVVAVLKGQEKHTFWRRVPTSEYPNKIEQVGEHILNEGEIISFTPNAIHQVEATADKPTVSFHLYGDTQPKSRMLFDAVNQTAKPF